jgi:DNA polymerase elongation subunit (family B)
VAPPVYGLDIETDTTRDGLDPAVGAVVAVGVAGPGGEVVFDGGGHEGTLLAELDRWLGTAPAGVIATWNGSRFDLPYLASRAALAGVALGLQLELDPARLGHEPLPGHLGGYRAAWHRHAHLDAYLLYRADVGPALRLSCSLKTVARLAGLAPVDVDATAIHRLGPDEVAAYVASDARCTRALVLRRGEPALRALDRLDGALPGCPTPAAY